MNKADWKQLELVRGKLEEAKDLLDELTTSEQTKFENMSQTGLSSTERGQAIESAAESLGEARDNVESALDNLGNIQE